MRDSREEASELAPRTDRAYNLQFLGLTETERAGEKERWRHRQAGRDGAQSRARPGGAPREGLWLSLGVRRLPTPARDFSEVLSLSLDFLVFVWE